MLGERGLDTRNEIAAIGLIVGMLELAAAAFREMAAWRLLVMRAECERAVVEHRVSRHSERNMPATWSYAVSPCRNADNRLVHSKDAKASGIASTRSSAIICGTGNFGGETVQPYCS